MDPTGRSAEDIRIATKIETHGGPFYRECESAACFNIENKNVDKLMQCSRCMLASLPRFQARE